MAGNSFGQQFRITTFGESHGPALGVVIDGCPAGLALDESKIQAELDRRRPGQNALTTPRDEKDQVEILSGVFEGKTTGTPLAMMVRNANTRSQDYDAIKDKFRPGHADFTYEAKYGFRDWRGSGRASARETLARVAAAAVAKQILNELGVELYAHVSAIGEVRATRCERDEIEKNPVRTGDPDAVQAMTELIEQVRDEGDSIGGVIEVIATGLPAGLGEPVFHKLSADLGQAILSLPAVKGMEIGSGFEAAQKRGSENNDAFTAADGSTASNHAGGILGGISNGQPLVLRFAVKAASSIAKTQDTVSRDGEATQIEVKGRHDPCVAPRAVPIGEAMVALVLVDHLLLNLGSKMETLKKVYKNK